MTAKAAANGSNLCRAIVAYFAPTGRCRVHRFRLGAVAPDAAEEIYSKLNAFGSRMSAVNVNTRLFPTEWQCGILAIVKHRFAIRHLLAALAMLGLVLGPMAAPTMAMPMSMDMAVSSATDMDMSDGMPCCPDSPAKLDCAKVCPFMAVCAGLVFPGLANGAILTVPTALLAVMAPRDDIKVSGLGQAPPPRPPKASLV